MLNNVKIKTIVFAAISAAVLSACGGGGGGSPSTQLVNNAQNASSVTKEIEGLPTAETLTISDKAKLEHAKDAYNKLSDKSMVSQASVDKLNALIDAYNSNVQLAQNITVAIAKLPSDISKSGEAVVASVRSQYDALTENQKTWVEASSVSALEKAESAVKTNEKLAESVQANIAALPSEIAKADAAKVTAARKNLTDLTDAQETWVEADSVSALKKAEATVAANQTKAAKVAEQISALPANGLDIDTDKEIAAYTAAKKAFDDLSDSEETWVDSAATQKLAEVGKTVILDNDSLPALNLPTPLHTSFISSAGAQQNNPNVQLRNIDGKPEFTYDQGGLISSLEFNPNDEVKLDGIIIANNTDGGSATQVSFTTPASMIVKAYSGGISKEDVSAQKGEKNNTTFEVGKTSFDDVIVSNWNELKAAKDSLKAAENELAKLQKDGADEIDIKVAEEKVKELKAEIPALQDVYEQNRQSRQILSARTQSIADGIAYIKKDKNGLVFDKKFDGVYIVQFTDGTRIVMHDPAAAGWTYQTFAHYVDPKNGVIHGYQTLGDETAFGTMPANGTATYNGLTTAYLVEGGAQKQLTADVKAVVDFAKKGVRFETNNSQFHSLNNGVRTSAAAAAYNIKGTAAWGNTNHFTGNAQTSNGLKGDLNGKFYGANAAEIGGTYGLKNGSAQLIGGYGAKRQ